MFHDVLGLKRGTVVLHPHSEKWKLAFEKERGELEILLGEAVFEIHHIGSTSTPPLFAKPVIDILVALHNFSDIELLREKLEASGYEYQENDSNEFRVLFAKGPEETRTHHVHLTEHQSPEWEKAFLFWDYLRTHPEALEEYNLLKQELAKEHPDNRDQYSKGKAPFIQDIIRRAQKNL